MQNFIASLMRWKPSNTKVMNYDSDNIIKKYSIEELTKNELPAVAGGPEVENKPEA